MNMFRNHCTIASRYRTEKARYACLHSYYYLQFYTVQNETEVSNGDCTSYE